MSGIAADLCRGLTGAGLFLGHVEAFDIVFLVSSCHLVAAQCVSRWIRIHSTQENIPHSFAHGGSWVRDGRLAKSWAAMVDVLLGHRWALGRGFLCPLLLVRVLLNQVAQLHLTQRERDPIDAYLDAGAKALRVDIVGGSEFPSAFGDCGYNVSHVRVKHSRGIRGAHSRAVDCQPGPAFASQ